MPNDIPKFMGQIMTTIDDKCRVTIPYKFRKNITRRLKIEQVEGSLRVYESNDGLLLDSDFRLQLGRENVDYLGNRRIAMSGEGSYFVIENENTALTLKKMSPLNFSSIYDKTSINSK